MKKLRIIVLILFSIIPVVAATTVCLVSFSDKTGSLIKENMVNVSKVQTDNLNSFFERIKTNIVIARDMSLIREFLVSSNIDENPDEAANLVGEVSDLLTSFKNKQPYILQMSVVNKYGFVLSSSDGAAVNSQVIFHEEIKAFSENEVYYSEILSDDSYWEGSKYFVAAIPIYMEDGYEGFIMQTVSADYFKSITNNTSFYDMGTTSIVDKSSLLLASNSKYLIDRIGNLAVVNNFHDKWRALDFASNPNGFLDYTVEGVKKIGYYSNISGTDWYILISAELSELTKPIMTTVGIAIGVVAFLMVVMISIFGVAASKVSTPIREFINSIHRIKKGEYKNKFEYHKNDEFGEIVTAFNELVDVIVKNTEQLEYNNLYLKTINANIPCGVYSCTFDCGYRFTYLNDGYLKLLGYNEDEFRKTFDNTFINTVYRADRDMVMQNRLRQLEKTDLVETEYRVRRQDGKIIWIYDRGQKIITKEGDFRLYCIVMEITSIKEAQDVLRQSEEKYRIVVEQLDGIICEWDFATKTISCSSNWYKKFGYPLDEDIRDNRISMRHIHPDDRFLFRKWVGKLYRDKESSPIELRIKNISGSYIWMRLKAAYILDSNGEAKKSMWVMIDIDKDRKEKELLKEKAQTDSLTEMYNREATETLISEYLRDAGKDKKSAMFVIDIDNFKLINDNLGHRRGDDVLKETAKRIQELFRASDVIGRIGGDEFVVFLKHIPTEKLIVDKAEAVINVFRDFPINEEENHSVSASVGIAVYPRDGENYDKLFKKADSALYYAKNHGKNCYHIYVE